MPGNTVHNLGELARRVGRYPEEAFLFVREGLNYAEEQVHGPETHAHQVLARYLRDQGLDSNDLIAQYHAGELNEALMGAIEAAGGCDKLNRHVGGRELCWGLRDFAIQRWGLLARTVLETWNVRTTHDFGRIVFAFIEQNIMQKQDGDCLSDFDDVYVFDEAFDDTFHLGGDPADGPEANN